MDENKNLKAMISSTSLDLPEHRKQVLEACQRQNIFSVRMEDLPALGATADLASLKMVDVADIYIGVFAHRYGFVPKEANPTKISITEMEYNRAVERKMPRMIFIIDDTHPLTIKDVEHGRGATKLAAFLKRVKGENIVKFFVSPDALRAEVINSLAQYKEAKAREKAERKTKDTAETAKAAAAEFHYVGTIPPPPEEFIAHPYTLLQTHKLIGRQDELNLLTEWVAKPESNIYRAHILSVVAIGGMGKSALTWKWFNEIAPQEMKSLAGRMWWSFYESDATFENFVIRALAYVSKRPIEDVTQLPAPDRETQLLYILDKEPHLIVLDGLERILIAYARMDAAYLSDSDYDQRTANYVAKAYGLPASAAKSFAGEHRLRKTADPRAGAFLRKLAGVRTSRVLISTRLYPFDVQRLNGSPLPGCNAIFLSGLSNDDALNLWRSFGVSGGHGQLVPIFNSFGNHPLLLQALAREIANYRPAPGDFEKWKEKNPQFDPAQYPQVEEAMVHVLEYALHGLDKKAQKVLATIAGFRMPTGYESLSAVLVGEGKACASAGELDAALSELEDRGLVGWDRRANRYDLHPIVRGVVWSRLGDEARHGVYTGLRAHFEFVPMIEDWHEVESMDDLAPAVELYYTLAGLGRFDDAYSVFRDRLNDATLYRLSASRQCVELLEILFPNGTDQLPRLSTQYAQGFTLNGLALGYKISGQPGRAASVYRRATDIFREMEDEGNLGIELQNWSNALRQAGGLRESEGAARRALNIFRNTKKHFSQGISLHGLGLAMATRGAIEEAKEALDRSLRMVTEQNGIQGEGFVTAYLAQRALWMGEYEQATLLASRAEELAQVKRLEADIIRAARLAGEAALGRGNTGRAEERLHLALKRARAVNLVEEGLPALTALAELRRRQGEEKAARDVLDDVWEYAERGPYPLLHADALNVLAQIERDAGNRDKAVEAATKAYELAWCDGPPFAYHWGLIKAQKHLEELGARLPAMPPFDESKFEPMPDVEIDPEDEFHVGEAAD
jgi:tetratricopeptide (TPR) repeat protein